MNVCDNNLDDYIEYIDLLRKKLKEIIITIKEISIRKLEKADDITNLRYNVHKLISHICYLEKNEELIYLCRYILFQPKKEKMGESLNTFNYLYYTTKLLDFDFSSMF
jgi:hypothetical protein